MMNYERCTNDGRHSSFIIHHSSFIIAARIPALFVPEGRRTLAGGARGRSRARPPEQVAQYDFAPRRGAGRHAMSSTHLSLHYHVIFSTKNRERMLDDSWRDRMHAFLGGAIKTLGAFPEKSAEPTITFIY